MKHEIESQNIIKKNKIIGPIFICAGEPSGDLYAALLLKKLKKNSNLKIYGVGGDEMQKSGAEVIENYDNLMTFGFSAGIFSILENYRVYKKIAQKLYEIHPKTFVAVAYPGINLLLCSYAKRLGCKVYYLLPPQIWAWGEFRKFFIKKWVDRVISLFPFEYEFYKNRGISTTEIENPLVERLKKYKRVPGIKKRIGFMPGSRKGEIKRNLPIMLEIIKGIKRNCSDIEFFLIFYKGETSPKALLRGGGKNIKIIRQNRYQAMRNCDFLIIASGTASLEAAIMNIPQVFFNRPSFFDYYIFKRFLKIREYSLPNLYFCRKVVPSIINYNSKKIKNYVLSNKKLKKLIFIP